MLADRIFLNLVLMTSYRAYLEDQIVTISSKIYLNQVCYFGLLTYPAHTSNLIQENVNSELGLGWIFKSIHVRFSLEF